MVRDMESNVTGPRPALPFSITGVYCVQFI